MRLPVAYTDHLLQIYQWRKQASLKDVPPEFYSSGDTLMVRFRSDDTINTKGFSAAYTAFDAPIDENDDIMERYHL
ncbi:tolloid-like protein 1 [Trichonephila clavipes]|nr:tolloid-like protein 1 [Trichonephila clavipes]